jgi:dUTP pyrophosphatase
MIKQLMVKRLTEDAILPRKDRDEDEGYDIFASEDVVIPPKSQEKVKTGIAAWAGGISYEYPSSGTRIVYENLYWLQIEGRSGLASKGIFPVGGIVDCGYRGEIMALLVNNSTHEFVIKKGDKIAQLVIREHIHCSVNEVEELPESDRNEKGFGSSGTN